MLALLIASVVAHLSQSPALSSWAFIMRTGLKLALAAAILVWTGRAEPALSEPADFYKGKDIKLIVSATVGGGYDVYARALAKHLGAHIPGNPTIIPQNMPAAGGIAAANHMYNVAPRDGTIICLLQNTVAFEPFYANRQAQFDAAKFSWLGTPTTEVAMYIVRHASKIKTLADAQTQEMMAGGAGAASTPAFYGRVFNQLLNMKARLITGYPGQNEILLALENGEVEAMASPFWSSIKTMRFSTVWSPIQSSRACRSRSISCTTTPTRRC